jgi:DNA-binding CsgD family transcriptional regulator
MARQATVTNRDLDTMLGIIAAPTDEDVTEPMPWSVLVGLRELISCDVASISMFDARERSFHLFQEVGECEQIPEDIDRDLEQKFFNLYWESPSCNYPDISGDLTEVTLGSDFHSLRQWHATPMYCECLRYYGTSERELMICLPSQRGRALRVRLCRGPGSDFSPRDRGLAVLMRPHLYEAYRKQQRRQNPKPQLTTRQEELLGLVAAGYTNIQIGRRLSISEATVRKHLEHVFERLQVTSRTAAVTAYSASEGLASHRARIGSFA